MQVLFVRHIIIFMATEKIPPKRGRPPSDETASARVEFRAIPSSKVAWKKKAAKAGKTLAAWLTDLANKA